MVSEVFVSQGLLSLLLRQLNRMCPHASFALLVHGDIGFAAKWLQKYATIFEQMDVRSDPSVRAVVLLML